MSLNASWKQAADLEVIIIDDAYGRVESLEHRSVLDFKDLLGLRWLDFSNPAPELKRLELAYITYNMPDCTSHVSPRADWVGSLPMAVVVRVERNWHHWTLTPRQLRGWMET